MRDLLRVPHVLAELPGTAKALGPEKVRQAVPAQVRNVLVARGGQYTPLERAGAPWCAELGTSR
ncbi:hypothetical protein [Brachybacterium sp. HMSC06H03]|uniref:hypothetical protein n=1 Tax=Brachybacterium sp. HMSC06H03 TaxID=1581127 RepID=UPI00114C90A2|nr:hypothetical protein [Brachybacterium sp. HMSC06H03]